MPISRFLVDSNFTPEEQRLLESAFSVALRKLDLVDRGDPICAIVAQKIIEIAEVGVTGPEEIAELTVNQLDPR